MSEDKESVKSPVVIKREEKAFEKPSTEEQKVMVGIWKDILGEKKISIHDDFYDLGGNSLLGVKMLAAAQKKGVLISPKMFMVHHTIALLCEHTSEVTQSDQNDFSGEVPLLPFQHWYFNNIEDSKRGFQVIGVGYELDLATNQESLKKCFELLAEKHPMLKSRFECIESKWEHIIDKKCQNEMFVVKDLSNVPEEELQSEEEAIIADGRKFLVDQSPLFRAIYINFGESKPAHLYIIGHRLIMDLTSRAIILNDLQLSYRFVEKDLPVPFPPNTTSYKRWCDWMLNYASTDKLDIEKDYWLSLNDVEVENLPLKSKVAGNGNIDSSTEISAELDAETTIELMRTVNTVVPSQFYTDIYDILYTALVVAHQCWTGQNSIGFDVFGHGREDWINSSDLSRTIGRFSTIYPMRLKVNKEDSLGDNLENLESQLKKVPNRGFGYGMLRYVGQNSKIKQQLSALDNSDVFFHYHGNFELTNTPDHKWKHIRNFSWSAPFVSSEKGELIYKLLLQTYISDNQLKILCLFDPNVLNESDVKQFADNYIDVVGRIVKQNLVQVHTGIKQINPS